ncbi:MAG: hypothetical protein ABIQ74_00495, partial [Chitinophagales bacterium]
KSFQVKFKGSSPLLFFSGRQGNNPHWRKRPLVSNKIIPSPCLQPHLSLVSFHRFKLVLPRLYDTVGQEIEFCGKKPALRVTAKRWAQAKSEINRQWSLNTQMNTQEHLET